MIFLAKMVWTNRVAAIQASSAVIFSGENANLR